MKQRFNASKKPNCYFWRDTRGHEIDCLLEYGEKIIPVEIKSALTINQHFFDPLIAWKTVAEHENKSAFVAYAGEENYTRKHAMVVGWNSLDLITQPEKA